MLSVRSIPIGTAYAIWVGIGTVGTAAYSIIAGIIGLKLLLAPTAN